jgi:hypothetical protein
MINNTAKLDKEQMRLRNDLLREILDRDPEKPFFQKALHFYKDIFDQNPDLIVCMSRKSWCVIQLFLPFLKDAGINVNEKKLTHDRMVHPWFAELDQDKHDKIKIFVIDDTFQAGRAMDECVRRLKWAYNVNENNITIAVFAVAATKKNNKKRIDTEKNIYTVYPTHDKPELKINWWQGNTFYKKRDISAISYFFIEALHVCSVPYVGYIPAFRLPFKYVEKFLGMDRMQKDESDIHNKKYLEQDDLIPPLNDSSVVKYFNITSQQMWQHDIDAFYFSLPDDAETFYLPAFDSGVSKIDLPFFPPKHALSIHALRFYLNRKTGFALIVPYLSLKACRANEHIDQEFPKELRPLLKEMCSQQDWKDYEGHIAAYRLLRFAVCYLWGKYVLEHWFPKVEEKEKEIVSLGGICSEKFLNWLNGPYVEQNLASIWSFFDPKKGKVVEETQSLKPDSEAIFDDIINIDMPEDKEYNKVINDSLTVSVPVDYFSIAGMLFRNILTQEHRMQNKHEYKCEINVNNEARPLVDPFHGFPIHTFNSLFLLKFPNLKTRRDVLTTVTLMLCDTGEAVTQLCQYRNIIGTVLFNGEQSCHALAPVAPEYAHFLTDLPQMLLKFDDIEQRKKKYTMVKEEIKNYFEEEISNGIVRRLSVQELMSPLNDIETYVLGENASKWEFEDYSVLPRSVFFDCSELFFLKLRKDLTA